MSSPSPRRSLPGLVALARPSPPGASTASTGSNRSNGEPCSRRSLDPCRQRDHGVVGACGQTGFFVNQKTRSDHTSVFACNGDEMDCGHRLRSGIVTWDVKDVTKRGVVLHRSGKTLP